MCTTMAMSGAPGQAHTHSSCWVMTCSCSSARSTTRTVARGAGLHLVTRVVRTADLPGSRRSLQPRAPHGMPSVIVWFFQRCFDVVFKCGGDRGSGRDDPAEASHRNDRQEHVDDLVVGRTRSERPRGAPLQADR